MKEVEVLELAHESEHDLFWQTLKPTGRLYFIPREVRVVGLKSCLGIKLTKADSKVLEQFRDSTLGLTVQALTKLDADIPRGYQLSSSQFRSLHQLRIDGDSQSYSTYDS